MIRTIVLIILFLISPLGRSQVVTSLGGHLLKRDFNSLEDILRERYIKVITRESSIDYFVHNGVPQGIQYELVKNFVSYLNKKYIKTPPLIQFEMIPAPFDEMVNYLNEGRGDFIASDLNGNENLFTGIKASSKLRDTKKVLVVGSNYESGDKVYFEKKVRFSLLRELKVNSNSIKESPLGVGEKELIELVSMGAIKGAIVDSLLAEFFKNNSSNVIIKRKAEANVLPSSWFTRVGSGRLLQEINNYVPKIRIGSLKGNLIRSKYKKNLTSLKETSKNLNGNKISPFDSLLKKYGEKYNFDWRFLASVAFQESRFDHRLISKAGAIGAFQVKESTAREPYINILKIKGKKNLENNIHAGVKYLSWLKRSFFDNEEGIRDRDKIRLTLASYNAGPGKIKRARDLAKKMGLDPNKWFRNVEMAMIELGTMETVKYVSEINKRYVAYQLLVKE